MDLRPIIRSLTVARVLFAVSFGVSFAGPAVAESPAEGAASVSVDAPTTQVAVTSPAVRDGAPVPIERFNATLLEIMKGSEQLGYAGRFAMVEPVLVETFDVPFMAAKSVGTTWRKLDADQRQRWVAAFQGYMVSNFADRFDEYTGQRLEVVGEKPASHDTRVVLTRIHRPGDESVELNYRMRETDAGWRVVDIYSGGSVSEIALRRSEYAAVLKQGGIDKLIASVTAKTADRAKPAN